MSLDQCLPNPFGLLNRLVSTLSLSLNGKHKPQDS